MSEVYPLPEEPAWEEQEWCDNGATCHHSECLAWWLEHAEQQFEMRPGDRVEVHSIEVNGERGYLVLPYDPTPHVCQHCEVPLKEHGEPCV